MPLFRPRELPATSYGYRPPVGATARGWKCAKLGCGVSDHEPVRRWPKPCPQCGSSTNPIFDQPWAHDAEGVELEWIIRNHPEHGGGFHQAQWHIWQFKDALHQGELGAAEQARRDARAHADERMRGNPRWEPGGFFLKLIWYSLEARNLDWAADDLIYWLSISSTEDVENNGANRTNSRMVIDTVGRFLAAGGASHPRVSEIRTPCLKISEEAFQVLNNDQLAIVSQLAHQERLD